MRRRVLAAPVAAAREARSTATGHEQISPGVALRNKPRAYARDG